MAIRVLIDDIDNFDMIDLMNQYVKLKVKYWTIDFLKLQIDLDYVYVENDRVLRMLSNDIYGSELIINEMKNIINFFKNYKVEISGTIEKKIDISKCEFMLLCYDIYNDTIIYKNKKFCHNVKFDELNYMCNV